MIRSKPKVGLERRPSMTIVAGFPGPGFVVLAADSEEGGGLTKSSVHKIALIDKGDSKVLIGGAGHGDFIDLAVQHADEQIAPKSDLKTIRVKLERIVTDIYSQRIESYPEHQREQCEFHLLCALWSQREAGKSPQLIRVGRAVSLIRRAPEAIGIGTYLARYLMATLGIEGHDVYKAVRLAIYVIAQAKKYVAQCGGQTQVVVLSNDGTVVEIASHLMAQHELTSTLLVEQFSKLLFYATDPVEHGMDGDKMKAAIESGVADLTAKFQNPVFLLQQLGIPVPIKPEGQ